MKHPIMCTYYGSFDVRLIVVQRQGPEKCTCYKWVKLLFRYL